MNSNKSKQETIAQLQQKILQMQGFKAAATGESRIAGLQVIEQAFPNQVFPLGTVHELISEGPEGAAASGGFMAGLLGALMNDTGVCIWISTSRKLFPPALEWFGTAPDRIIFADLLREKDILWATEEALKCEGVTAVVAELREMTFAQSRRLQLVVEKSGVTAFIWRKDPEQLHATTSVARWKVSPAPSLTADDLPGVGFPQWKVELLKVRNGIPGSWQVCWSGNRFHMEKGTARRLSVSRHETKKTG